MPFGIALRRGKTAAPDRADALADIVLRAHTGPSKRLGDLWRERPAVLVFLRHFG